MKPFYLLSIIVGVAAFVMNVARGQVATSVTVAFVIALQVYNLAQIRELRRLRASASANARPPES